MILFDILSRHSGFWLPKEIWMEIKKQYDVMKKEDETEYKKYVYCIRKESKHFRKNNLQMFINDKYYPLPLVSKDKFFLVLLSGQSFTPCSMNYFKKVDCTIMTISCSIQSKTPEIIRDEFGINRGLRKPNKNYNTITVIVKKEFNINHIIRWLKENLQKKYAARMKKFVMDIDFETLKIYKCFNLN